MPPSTAMLTHYIKLNWHIPVGNQNSSHPTSPLHPLFKMIIIILNGIVYFLEVPYQLKAAPRRKTFGN
jgi:hypothetical protein